MVYHSYGKLCWDTYKLCDSTIKWPFPSYSAPVSSCIDIDSQKLDATRLDLIHNSARSQSRLDKISSTVRLDLIHTRLDFINSRLDVIHLVHFSARSHSPSKSLSRSFRFVSMFYLFDVRFIKHMWIVCHKNSVVWCKQIRWCTSFNYIWFM